MGPDELDDLLASIRAEGKKSSALALYEGTREDDLVDENVDERILKLLGLSDVFDIDYGTYTTLLKERLAASRSFGKKLSTEEDELLVEEFRKVKGKVGRFKIKKKRITAENLGVTGPVKVSTEKFYLTSKAIIPESTSAAGESADDIKDISEALDDLLKSIRDQYKHEQKKAEESRKEDEQKKRAGREKELEKPLKKVLGALKKVVAPFQSILDRILKFIQFTFLGFLLNNVMKWFADPANKKKVEVIGRFLKDFWPAILGAYVLFATPFGKFVRTTLTLLRSWIPKMARFLTANPWVAAAAGITGLAIAANEITGQRQAASVQTENKANAQMGQGMGVQATDTMTDKVPSVGSMGATTPYGMLQGVAGGGRIKKRSFFGGGGREVNVKDIAFEEGGGIHDDSGVRITGAGPDTQLIAAQPGEVMMSKKAVDKYGANFFLGLNKRAGGTNIPRMVNNIQLAQGGGMIGRAMNFLGGLGLPGTGSVMAPNYTGMGYQNKFLGMNLNRVNLPQIPDRQFSQSEVQRYNQSPTAPSTIRNWSPYDPVQVSVPKATSFGQGNSFVGDAFRNFGQNVKTIKGAAGRQEKMMREMGVKPSGYVNLRGQPINLGPQSRAMPVGTPTIISRSQTIVLPPQTMPGKKPSVPVKTGTQIPDVSIVAAIPYREMVIRSLGIGDLMGVG